MAFLHDFFSKLPTQVFRGCVDGIRPNNKLDFWSLGACTQFSKLTNSWGAEGKRKCIGEITAINEKVWKQMESGVYTQKTKRK